MTLLSRRINESSIETNMPPAGIDPETIVSTPLPEAPVEAPRKVSRRMLFAGLAGAGAVAVVSATLGINASHQPSVEAIPPVDAPQTPVAPSTVAKSPNTAPALELPFGYPSADWDKYMQADFVKAADVMKAATTPEQAVNAFRTLSKDSQSCYMKAITMPSMPTEYGSQTVYGNQINTFMTQLQKQDPNALPASFVKNMRERGPGKELLNAPQAVVDDMNARLIIASAIAQNEALSKGERKKMTAVIMSTFTGPNRKDAFTAESFQATTASKLAGTSVLYFGDYMQQLYSMIDSQQNGSLKVASLLELDKSQTQLTNPTFTANMILGAGGTAPVKGMAVATRLYGDTSSKEPVVQTVVAIQSGAYTNETIALTQKLSFIGPDYSKWVSTRTVSDTDATPIFKNFKSV